MDADDDSALEEALAGQNRPVRPTGMREAREQMEQIMLPGLIRAGLSASEARVEAMNMLARFERLAVDRALQDRVEGKRT